MKNLKLIWRVSKQKKSQLEILGLAIIVILLTLGILFIIRFTVLKEPTDLRPSYTNTEMASNMLNTIIRTQTTCKDKPLRELLQDCAAHPPIGSIDCDGTLANPGNFSCNIANKTIGYIMNATFVRWGLEYQFDIWLDDGTELVHIIDPPGSCTGEKESKPMYIPLQLTQINLRLDICS